MRQSIVLMMCQNNLMENNEHDAIQKANHDNTSTILSVVLQCIRFPALKPADPPIPAAADEAGVKAELYISSWQSGKLRFID